MNKLGMSIMISHPDNPCIEEQIPLFAKAGFDSFFLSGGVTSDFSRIPAWAEIASKNGIAFETVHAPARGVNYVWLEESATGEDYLSGIRDVIDHCQAGGVGKLVMHVTAWDAPPVCQKALDRFAALEEYAESKGVCICYENTVSTEHLIAVMEHCGDYHGFCLDIGHHLCYAPQVPFLSLFGNKLKYTHIHDNFGIQQPGNPGGDLHLLPFDGILDWQWFATALRNIGYHGTLNLELAATGKESYRTCRYSEFVAEAYKRIAKVREMFESAQ